MVALGLTLAVLLVGVLPLPIGRKTIHYRIFSVELSMGARGRPWGTSCSTVRALTYIVTAIGPGAIWPEARVMGAGHSASTRR